MCFPEPEAIGKAGIPSQCLCEGEAEGFAKFRRSVLRWSHLRTRTSSRHCHANDDDVDELPFSSNRMCVSDRKNETLEVPQAGSGRVLVEVVFCHNSESGFSILSSQEDPE